MKTVLITGCSSGFGREAALAFARSGYRVFATTRDRQSCTALSGAAVEEKLPIELLELDLTDNTAITGTVDHVRDKAGSIDILVNNAGTIIPGALEDLTVADIETMMRINFFAPLYLSRAVLPYMRAQGGGLVIMLSSLSALVGLPGEAVYCAGKAALETAAEGLREEVAPFNIKLCVIEPGHFNTGMPEKIAAGYVCPPGSVYAALIAHLEEHSRAGLGTGEEPQLLADLLLEVAAMPGPPLRIAAGVQARTVLATLPTPGAESREAFVRSVNGTGWWAQGESVPPRD